MVRNSYSANPYHDDPIGALSDLADFYKSRIEALRSDQELLLDTKVPKEYEWLRALAPEGFSKGFSIGRTYMSCDDPCKKTPSSYRWISISGRGIGDEPGDIGTPFEKIVKKLLSEGWSKCRSTDDSGKPTMDYFVKNDKMVELFRYFSMGAGNSISFGITISPPLPENPPKPPPNPAVTVTRDWSTYSSSDKGLQFRYPPGWRIKGESAAGSGTKEVMIVAWDYTGNLTISVQPKDRVNHQSINPNNEDTAPKCIPSHYRISGVPAQTCLFEGENVGDGSCNRYIEFIDGETDRYLLLFTPAVWGSLANDSGEYRLTDLYEKILSTIEIRQDK